MIRPIEPRDHDAVTAIYNHYVVHTVVTFDETPISLDETASRVQDVLDAGFPWLVAEENGAVIGYAYASRWKSRCSYRYTAESSVYLGPGHGAKGWGTKLYEALFARLRAMKVHAVIGGISLPNPASVALHEKFGMKPVARYPEVGWKFGKWVDVGYWQAVLPYLPTPAEGR